MVLFLNWKRSESVQSLCYSCSKSPGHQLGTRASAAPFVYGSDVIGAEPSVRRKPRPSGSLSLARIPVLGSVRP